MSVTLSLKGIDEAIANLNYKNPQALKAKLVHSIRGFYQDENALRSLGQIDPDVLINAMWDTGDDPAATKAKRKNFSSTKSSVNGDLKRLFEEGKNADGVIIGRDNVFVMSDEAKNKLISTLGPNSTAQTASLREIAQSLNAIKEALSKPGILDGQESLQASATLKELRNTIQGLSQRIGTGDNKSRAPEGPEGSDALEKPAAGDQECIGPARGARQEAPAEAPDRTGTSETADAIKEPSAGKQEATDRPADRPDAGNDVGPESVVDEGVSAEDMEETDIETPGLEETELEKPLEQTQGVEAPEALEEEAIVDDADLVDQIVEEVLEVDEDPAETDAVEDDDLEEVLEAIDGVEVDDQVPDSSRAQEIDEDAIEGDHGDPSDEDLEAEQAGPVDLIGDGGAGEAAQEVGLPAEIQEEQEQPGLDGDNDTEKSRHLAEVFDGYLGTTERFYNQYILIPAGDYKVGSKSPKGEERLEQPVRLASFYVGKFPVTNALFEIFIEKTGYVTTAEKAGFGTVYYGRLCKEVDDRTGAVRFRCNGTVQSKTLEGAFWYQPFGPGSTLYLKKNHPVVQVSLADAMAFAAWTGKRLPSESEWEAAARSEKGHVYPWGDDWRMDACNTEDSAVANTTPVDAFKEMTNAFAVADTLGNVLEWTSEAFHSGNNPTDSHQYYIAKGGSWISEKDVCLFSRFKVKADAPSNILGFRCVAH